MHISANQAICKSANVSEVILEYSITTDEFAYNKTPTQIGIVDLSKRDDIRSLKGHTADISCMAWASDGKKLASGSNIGEVIVWFPDEVVETKLGLVEPKAISSSHHSVLYSTDSFLVGIPEWSTGKMSITSVADMDAVLRMERRLAKRR